ncbi:MAG: hypothetical protein OHK0039_43060 [Bacteroidia bacterium]
MTKKIYLLLLPWLIAILPLINPLRASHIMGVDISYECTGPCTYRIYHRTYYDCTGAFMVPGYVPVSSSPAPPAPSGFDFTITGNGNCIAPTPIGGWTLASYEEVTPVCPDLLSAPPGTPYPTGCEGNPGLNPNPPINGVAEAIYYVDYNFCSANCNIYTISWSNCCRNGAIDSGAANEGIFTGETQINLGVQPCNSSPTFIDPITGDSKPPIAYICAGQTSTFNQGAYDPDGDSLSYELGPCYDGAGAAVTYNLGYSPNNPLGPSWSVSINPLTGDITFSPNPSGSQVVGVMCIVVKEWRNGVLIGQVVRDMQVTVITNCAASNPTTGGIQSLVLGQDSVPAFPLSFNEVRVCAGVEFCFEIPVISQDSSLEYTLWWDQSISGATFSDATNPAIQDTVVGPTPTAQFCWTPPAGSYGTYFFLVSVRDDGCPVPGLNQYTVIIYVDDVLANANAVGVPVGCNEVELSVVPNSTLPSAFNTIFPVTQWTGNGNLNLNPNTSDSSFTHLYPAPGVYTFNLALEDTFGCKINLPGIVDLTTGVTANAGPDVTICSNYQFTLGTPALPGQYYSWSPPGGLNDSTLAQPTFTYADSTSSGQAVFNYVLTVTDSICTTFDYTSVIVNPSLGANIITADSVICAGDSTVLTAVGNLSAGFTYLWSTGDTSQSITVNPTTATTYSVVLFNNGCASDPATITVDVQSGPPPLISGNFRVCPGASTVLTASGGSSYVWSAGGFTGSSITITDLFQDSIVSVVAIDSEGCVGQPGSILLRPYPLPQPAFDADTVCEGSPTLFMSQSDIAEGSIAAYFWDFSDGTPDVSGASPTHTFGAPGIYNVTLTVRSNRGCIDSLTRAVRVESTPDVDFSLTNVCQGLPNAFNSTTTIQAPGSIAGYTWDFGDGSATVPGSNTVHVYDTSGFYNVNLTVVSDAGCSSSFVRTAFVHPIPVADFVIISACEDSLVLASSGSSVGGGLDFINAYAWDFGDPGSANNTSTLLRPSHVYPQAGVYTVTHSVTTGNGCTDQVVRNVTIYPSPDADFTYDMNCENDRTVFTDNSVADPATPLEYWAWDVGTGDALRLGQTMRYGYEPFGPGLYNVMHAVRTTQGCVDTIYKEVIINPQPNASFAAAPVCLYDSTLFEDLSTIAYGDIVSWSYDFGDGRQSTLPQPAHLYFEPGEYRATLTVVSDSGCFDDYVRTVEVRPLPELIDIRDDSVCFGDQAFLIALADPTVRVLWFYGLDDETPFNEGSSYATPPLPFETTYYVMPQTRDNLRCENVRQPVTGYVYEDEDLALFSSADVVDLPLAVIEFGTGASIPLADWRWNFGDGSTATQPNPVHEYQYPGRYAVTVDVTDVNGCQRTLTKTVEVRQVIGISVPSAFSPNGDEINDRLTIGHYNISTFQMSVFNRWGQIIYETDNLDFAWDGTTIQGKPAREGVYVYVLKAVDFQGNVINESRTITIIK